MYVGLLRFLCQIVILMTPVIRGQYHIREGLIPSYFYHKFDKLDDDIFPAEIKIKMSLSKFSGTLLYSIDKNKNQLIISLQDFPTILISFEFRRQSHYYPISKICNCVRCRFEMLELRLTIGKNINFVCNTGAEMTIATSNTIELNTKYPIPDANTSTNEGHLWLVNRPQSDKIFPNNDQLSGCIFSILINKNPINFIMVTNNIERKCSAVCNDQICNGGECYETYDLAPICNCTQTFLNGPYCNTSISSMNIRLTSQSYQFDMFKVSWISSSREILVLNNSIVQIRLYRNDEVISTDYSYVNGLITTTKKIVSDHYVANHRAIYIVTFYDSFFHVQFYHDGFNISTTILTNRNLKNEIFDTMVIRSGNGSIDMVYKRAVTDNGWSPLNIKMATIILDEFSENYNSSADPRKPGNIGIIVIIIILTCAVPIIGTVFLIKFCVQKPFIRRQVTKFLNKSDTYKKRNISQMNTISDEMKNRKKTLDDNFTRIAEIRVSTSGEKKEARINTNKEVISLMKETKSLMKSNKKMCQGIKPATDEHELKPIN